MISRLYTLLLAAALTLGAAAQSPQKVLDQAIAALKSAGAVTANYAVKGSQGSARGTISMSGQRYYLSSTDMKTWFDGTTQWTYSTATGEVNITAPDAAELQMANPMAAANDFKRNYNMWKAAGQIPGHYAIMMMPKKKKAGSVEQVYLYIGNTSHLPAKIHVKLSDGSAYTVSLTNYKTGVSLPASTFTFDKSKVPAGTPVVDLR